MSPTVSDDVTTSRKRHNRAANHCKNTRDIAKTTIAAKIYLHFPWHEEKIFSKASRPWLVQACTAGYVPTTVWDGPASGQGITEGPWPNPPPWWRHWQAKTNPKLFGSLNPPERHQGSLTLDIFAMIETENFSGCITETLKVAEQFWRKEIAQEMACEFRLRDSFDYFQTAEFRRARFDLNSEARIRIRGKK